MHFEDLEVDERRLIPDSQDEANLLSVALSNVLNGTQSSENGPQVGQPLSARLSSHALLGLRQLAVTEAIANGEYMEDPNAVPPLHAGMSQEDLSKIVTLADARVQSLTGTPE